MKKDRSRDITAQIVVDPVIMRPFRELSQPPRRLSRRRAVASKHTKSVQTMKAAAAWMDDTPLQVPTRKRSDPHPTGDRCHPHPEDTKKAIILLTAMIVLLLAAYLSVVLNP